MGRGRIDSHNSHESGASDSALELLRERLGGKKAAPRKVDEHALSRLLEGDIAAAVIHDETLGQPFLLARDEAALRGLSESDRAMPVLYYGEKTRLEALGVEGVRALLRFREVLGPSVVLKAVRLPDGSTVQ